MTRETAEFANRDAFICALLEPLPEGVPVDTHYNALMRKARHEAWWKASIVTRYRRAILDYLCAQSSYVEKIEQDTPRARRLLDQRHKAVKPWREAIASQIRTPAHCRADVAWKKAAAKDKYLPILTEEIAAAIAADEAFLDAHPVTSHPRKRGVVGDSS